MENLLTALTELLIQLVVIFAGAVIAYIGKKAVPYIEIKKQQDKLGIIELISWKVVEFVEYEFRGEAGAEKQRQAILAVITILEDKGIKITEEEIISNIQDAYNRLKINGLETKRDSL